MDYIDEVCGRISADGQLRRSMYEACELITECFERAGKVLLCGNGGSAADCEHISGELLKGFLKKRPLAPELAEKLCKAGMADSVALSLQCGLSAIPLTSLTSLNTAFANDGQPDGVFAQGVVALGRPADVLIAITTSAGAANVKNAILTARCMGLKTIALTGERGAHLRELCDCVICVPQSETYRVQELHIVVYHAICAQTEMHFFPV